MNIPEWNRKVSHRPEKQWKSLLLKQSKASIDKFALHEFDVHLYNLKIAQVLLRSTEKNCCLHSQALTIASLKLYNYGSQTCSVSRMVVQYIIVDSPAALFFETSFTSSLIKDIDRLHVFTP